MPKRSRTVDARDMSVPFTQADEVDARRGQEKMDEAAQVATCWEVTLKTHGGGNNFVRLRGGKEAHVPWGKIFVIAERAEGATALFEDVLGVKAVGPALLAPRLEHTLVDSTSTLGLLTLGLHSAAEGRKITMTEEYLKAHERCSISVNRDVAKGLVTLEAKSEG